MIGPFNLKRVLEVALMVKPWQVVPVAEGVSSFTYRLVADSGIYYLSTPNSELKHKTYAPKAKIFEELKKVGVLAPYVVEYRDLDERLDGYCWMITTEVVGGPAYDYADRLPDKFWMEAGMDLARVHSVKVAGWGYINGLANYY